MKIRVWDFVEWVLSDFGFNRFNLSRIEINTLNLIMNLNYENTHNIKIKKKKKKSGL
jgi:hypothetical protein